MFLMMTELQVLCFYKFLSYQSVLYAAAHLVFRLRRYNHVTDALAIMHWLRVPERVNFKLAPSPDWRRARGRPLTTCIHQIRQDTGIPVTDALELAEDRSFW